MNKSAATAADGLSKPVSDESPVSRTSTISSLSSDNYNDQIEESQESSWATYADDIDRQQPKILALCGSFDNEKIAYDCFVEKARDQCGKSIFTNRKIIKMEKKVDEDLEDTACSPHSSPTVSYMNQLNMMKLKTSSYVQEKMGNPGHKTEINSNKERSELAKMGFCIVPSSSINFQWDKVVGRDFDSLRIK